MTDAEREARIAELLAIIESELTPLQRYELEKLRRADRLALARQGGHEIVEATDEQIAEARRLLDEETERVRGRAHSAD